MKIKAVCERTGLTDRTIRYYIEEGLLSPSFNENYIGRKSFDFTEENIAQLSDIAVLRSFDFSIEEIRQILKDPSSSPSIIQAVKERAGGELTTSQKKTSLLSSLHEETPYTVSDLARQLSSSEITHLEKRAKPKLKLKIGIALAGLLILIGVLIFVLVRCDKICKHRDKDDNAFCDACGESFTDAVDTVGFQTLGVSGTTVYGKVSSTTTRFSFIDEISAVNNITYQVFRDPACKELIENKTPELVGGDNIFYVLTYTGGESNTLYTVTVRRKPLYTVTFDTAGGTPIASQTVEEDAFIAAPDIPQKTGHTFASWSRDLALPVTADITIQANWAGKPYTVTYNANGGAVNVPSVSFTYGQSYALETPNRNGYFFEGWFYGENKIEVTGNWEFADNITLIAKWAPNTDTPYRVEHYIERLDGTYELKDAENFTGTSDAEVIPATKYYEGYTAPAMQTVTVLSDGTKVVRYEYVRSSYTVTFVSNSEAGISTQKLKHGASIPATTRTGYTFGGWFKDAYLLQPITSVPTQDITIYAWWTEETKARSFLYFGTDEITITDFMVNDSAVCIPDFIGGKPVTCIGDGAFMDCSSLFSITIPAGVTNISSAAFQSCHNIASITVKAGNAVYHSKGNCLIETATNTLLLGCKNSIIPDYVTSIGNGAFAYCSNLNSITLPAGLTSIGEHVFYGCSGLTSVTIPAGVTSIADGTFNGCSRLTSVTIPAGVTSIGYRAFYNCLSLISITLPSNLISIGQYAFYGCYSLASITIPAGVTNIADDTFGSCFDLKSVTISNGVKSIGNHVFYNCTSLESITLPASVTGIGKFTFYNCHSLTSITLPAGLTSIGDGLFSSCSSLASLELPAGVISIGSSAFHASGLRSITLPVGVTIIGNHAFSECDELVSITIPNSVTHIGTFVFYHCYNLTSITIPASVTNIGREIFTGCSALRSLTVPLWYLPQCFEYFYLVPDMQYCCLYEYDGKGKPAGISDFEKNQQFGGWYADAALTVPFDFDAWLTGERTVGDTLTLYTKTSMP